MLTRENFTGRAWRRNARSRRTTAGILMTIVTERMLWLVLLEHLDLAEEQQRDGALPGDDLDRLESLVEQ